MCLRVRIRERPNPMGFCNAYLDGSGPFDDLSSSLLLIDAIRTQHPREFTWSPTIDRLTGSDKVRRAVEGGRLLPLLEEWDREAAAFVESRKPFLLYPE